MNDGGNQKKLHDQVIHNQLLLDEKDIIIGLEIFCNKFKDYKVDDFIELINLDYLSSGRERLKLKLHQKMTFIKFIANIKQKLHLISHKPRSGKSITILNHTCSNARNGYIPSIINNLILVDRYSNNRMNIRLFATDHPID